MLLKKYGRELTDRFLVFMLVGLCMGCGKERKPTQSLIPEGYKGWTRICFNLKDAPQIKEEDGRLVFRFDSTGKINTSSDLEEGWAKDEYYYYNGTSRRELHSTGWGGGGMVWGEYTENKDGNYCSGFFVGTERQFKEHGAQSNHFPGNMKLE